MNTSPPSALLCFDFDGTFIDQAAPEILVPPLAAALQALRQRGANFAINTGRSLFQAIGGVRDLGLRDLPDYLIAWEREIYAPTRFHRWTDLGDWNHRCRKEHKKLFRKHRRLLTRMRDHIHRHSGARWIEEPEEPAGLIARDEPEMDHLCEFIDAEIAAAGATRLSYERNTIYLRFAHSNYNKGTSLAELARQLSVPRDRIFAIGDNHNDLTMLNPEVASMIACPSNAVPEVKQSVASCGGFVAASSCGAGIAEAIEHFFGPL